MEREKVREYAHSLPAAPGIYQFKTNDTILYIGKAVDLRERVRSYTDPRSNRISQMVEQATTIDYSVTDTETQALLLESNLIKQHQPRYNVRLKDDKSYPMVQLTDHSIPRIKITRNPAPEATVFGPFTTQSTVEVVVKAIRDMYGLRGCSDSKYTGRDRPCIDYDIGLCTAPCTNEITANEYTADVQAVTEFFNGNAAVLLDPLQDAMQAAANAQQFERAGNLRDKIETIQSFHSDSDSVITTQNGAETVDSLGVAFEGSQATIARLHSEYGQLVDRSNHTLTTPSDTQDIPAVLQAFIVQYYAERPFPETLFLPTPLNDTDTEHWLNQNGVTVEVPGAGRHSKLVELAMKNARTRPNRKKDLTLLAETLGIESATRIEGFDISHSHGKEVVGSNVVFDNGEAATADYRRKKLTDKNDDYDNMYELVTWRAQRAVDDSDTRPDPDLILIDGGDGQLAAAQTALTESGWDIPAVALAKEHEIVITPDTQHDWSSDAGHLHVLQQVRDEAHRFAVQYHQTLRDTISTELDTVPGVGPKLRPRLLRRFGSIDGIRAATKQELTEVDGVGDTTAVVIQQTLHD